jgi:hypothetical protein
MNILNNCAIYDNGQIEKVAENPISYLIAESYRNHLCRLCFPDYLVELRRNI